MLNLVFKESKLTATQVVLYGGLGRENVQRRQLRIAGSESQDKKAGLQVELAMIDATLSAQVY